ncbi:MAG: MmgE/PrpD family protein [Pseudomonadota bacterium]
MSLQQAKATALPELAKIATNFTLTEQANIAAIEAVVDTVTAAAAAPLFPFTKAIWSSYGKGESPLWFTDQKTSVIGAAFANSYTSAALDLDDGHRASRGHPGACIVPAVLAALEDLRAAGKSIDANKVLKAIAVGYEVSLRIAGAKNFYARTGFWAGIAAAASVASLYELPQDKFAHALAIAGETGPHMATTTAGPAWPQPNGTHVKEGIPWGVASGIAAVQFAQNGMHGPLDLVDHEPFFNPEYILAPGNRPMVCETYTKFQATCRHVHGPVEAVDALIRANEISPSEITAVTVEAYSGALRISNHSRPKTIVEAQYSIPYCVGLAAVKGLDVFLPMNEGDLGHQQAEAIAEKVLVRQSAEFEREFPARTLCRVTIRTDKKEFVGSVTEPSGEANKRPTWIARLGKFETVTANSIPQARREALLNAFESLKAANIEPLLNALE